jgi:WD40 repeat protein
LAAIRELLRVSRALVVVDDVWDPAHVRSLVPREGAGRVLVTSRSRAVVAGIGGEPVEIDRLDDALARRFLARLAGLPELPDAESAPVIAAADGRPIRLAVYAGMIRRGVSWSEVSDRIALHDRTWGPDADAEYRAHEVSVSQLESTQPGLAWRFWKLAIFPEDTPVPVHVVAGLWGTDLDEALQSIGALLRAGLLSRSGAVDKPNPDGAVSTSDSIQLHDVTLDFLIRRGPYPEDWHFDLVTWARSLASDEHGTTRWSTLPLAERYLWGQLFHHLEGAGLSDEILETVLDPNWIGGRVSVTGGGGMLDDLSMAERLGSRNPALGHMVAEAAQCWRRDQHLILRAESEAPASAKVTAPRDTAAALWSPSSASATGARRWETEVRRLAGHDPRRSGTSLDLPLDGVTAVAWAPSGDRVAVAGFDCCIRVWDARSNTVLAAWEAHSATVWGLAWDPNGRRLASSSFDRTIRVWDPNDGTEVARLEGHTSRVLSVGYSPDGTRLVSGSGDGTIRVWDPNDGTEIARLEGHTSRVWSVGYSPDGTRLVSGSDDGTVRVWDPDGRTEIARLEGHTGTVWSVGYSPDGTRLVSGSFDGTVRVWDPDGRTEIARLEGHTGGVWSVGYSPDGTRLVSGSEDGTIRVWDPDDGTEIARLEGHPDRVLSVGYSPDGTRLVSGSEDGTIRVWDPEDRTEIGRLEGHTGTVLSVGYSPDGTRLVSGSFDGTVRVWDPDGRTEIARLEGHTGGVWSVGYSPDGTRLVSGSDDGTIRVWDPEDRTEIGRLEGHTDTVLSVGYSPDGTRLVSGSDDGTIRVWDPDGRTEIARLEGHTDPVWSVGYSPDGTRLVSGSDDGTIRVWDPNGRTEIARLEGHTDPVWSVGYSPDGTRLVSGSSDGTVRVWDPDGRTEIARLEGHSSGVWSVGYSPDGTRLVSGSDDGTIRVWDPGSGDEVSLIHVGFAVYALAPRRICGDAWRLAAGFGICWVTLEVHGNWGSSGGVLGATAQP